VLVERWDLLDSQRNQNIMFTLKRTKEQKNKRTKEQKNKRTKEQKNKRTKEQKFFLVSLH